MSKFSIITINFNNENGLRRTIESVINQTYTNYEYIVIDAGSTDDSKKVIKEYNEKITIWVSEPDMGIYHAMNKGLRKSRGEYVTFLNSGDFYLSTFSIDVINNCIKNKNKQADIWFFDYLYKSDTGTFLVSSSDVINKYIIFRKGFGQLSTFYRREILESTGGFDENFKISGDRDLYMKLIVQKKLPFSYFQFAPAVFVEGGLSTNMLYNEIVQRENQRIIEKYYSALEKKLINNQVFRKLLSINYLKSFLFYFLQWNFNRI